jgi:hypothetical protein
MLHGELLLSKLWLRLSMVLCLRHWLLLLLLLLQPSFEAGLLAREHPAACTSRSCMSGRQQLGWNSQRHPHRSMIRALLLTGYITLCDCMKQLN